MKAAVERIKIDDSNRLNAQPHIPGIVSEHSIKPVKNQVMGESQIIHLTMTVRTFSRRCAAYCHRNTALFQIVCNDNCLPLKFSAFTLSDQDHRGDVDPRIVDHLCCFNTLS